jgi:hypothetical protein
MHAHLMGFLFFHGLFSIAPHEFVMKHESIRGIALMGKMEYSISGTFLRRYVPGTELPTRGTVLTETGNTSHT